MGVTGAGKSYFIREVTGNPEVKVSRGLYSYTSKVQSYSFEYEGAKITLVDTPGFNDTEKSDTEILQEITAWTTTTYRQGQLLSGIIYLHPITHTRMEGSAMGNLRMFRSLCGQEALSNVFLTTTQWSRVDRTEGEFREDNLREDGLWGGLIGKGATLQRFHGTRESGLELIRKLMLNRPERLDIQDQIVEKRMTLFETGAGQCISEELVKLVEKYEGELESLRKRYQEAMEAKDREMGEALATEREETRRKLASAEDEKAKLAKLYEMEVERRDEEDRKSLKGIRKLKKSGSSREVIAIATRDIAGTAHFTETFTSYTTRGRFVYDINNEEEFESITFELAISYDLNSSNFPVDTRTIREMLFTGTGNTNYISLDGICYRCRSGAPITRGGQAFLIFRRS
ncbi:hypothetical protein B9Z19DRAFT_1033626 [Tuber borchii]|uniref:G domain-containing protein n=1 Tax=Tuber borchii TaxID=42251 RepID=A0A2T6ZFI5_TUBBO|nr:hypothetical protein B9Z19DRAFT_1033626 [Tuber borchii]